MKELRDQLSKILSWEEAHVNLKSATANIPFELLGKKSPKLPYSIWQLTEHIRRTQYDILDFCINPDYEGKNWPDDYWPSSAGPATEEEWEHTLKAIDKDRNAMIKLIKDPSTDLFKPLDHGQGQNLFREALLIADHTSYHTGQIILIRKIFAEW